MMGPSATRPVMHPIFFETIRQGRRLIIAVVGFTVVVLGIAMLMTPGPGWLVIFLGLSLLAVEFVWARRLLKRLKDKGAEIGERFINGAKETPHRQSTPPADAPRTAPGSARRDAR